MIKTPNLDRFAAQGMIFTDAHGSSAVCTPTRYGILTGRYNWRSRLKSGVLGGLSPRLIEPGRLTVPALLKEHGYRTAVIGKWHLGMDWRLQEGKEVTALGVETPGQVWNVDYTKPVRNGPLTLGFDYFFCVSASLDTVPYAFIEGDRVVSAPTMTRKFPMMEGRTNGFTREGPAAPGFEAEDVLPTLTRKAVRYIAERSAEARASRPFFLYLPLTAPHTPILPTPEWRGKNGLNPYGDFVMQVDWSVGKVLEALEGEGLAAGTLVIVASDNGCSPSADFAGLAARGHHPSYHFRGYKADIFDGGHRIPFMARWPGVIAPGGSDDHLACLNDLLATCADILRVKLPDNAGEDSVSLLPAFLGRPNGPWREVVVQHSINGSFAIRQGDWKLELCSGSGGWSAPTPGSARAKSLPPVQLYDLAADVGETRNVQAEHPEVVARLTKLLEKYAAEGRSTPGAPQENDGQVDIWRDRIPDARALRASKEETGD